MAELIIHTDKIKNNIKYLGQYFAEHNIEWSLITKVFSGDEEFLRNILTDDVIQHIGSVGDSRLTSLKNLRAVKPNMITIYIKPPAITYADEIVKYADISLNSSFSTIVALNDAAARIDKVHQIIIMIELGDLREGIKTNDIMDFYEKVFDLPHIEVIGIGSNLGCMYGVEPTYDNLSKLSHYKDQISKKFNKELKLISGGTSITLPLVERKAIPTDINHFRIGEAAFFGVSPLENKRFKELSVDTFEFTANIIELEVKNIVPEGIINEANVGHTAGYDNKDIGETTVKAILDFGLMDVDKKDLEVADKSIYFVGVTSDMMVIDIGSNKTEDGKKKYKIGDKISFKPNYMAVARLLNSKFIDKKFV